MEFYLPLSLNLLQFLIELLEAPLGCKILKFFLLNPFLFSAATAKQSPIASCSHVLLVGTIPRPASFTSGIKSFISDALKSIEFF